MYTDISRVHAVSRWAESTATEDDDSLVGIRRRRAAIVTKVRNTHRNHYAHILRQTITSASAAKFRR